MYDLHDYVRMIADRSRTEAYVRALQASVRPGCVVADIGTGAGIFALVACQLGARRVYGIETNDAIEVAKELAIENGVADRVVFIKDDASRIALPERADVVVSDLRGGMPSGALVLAHVRRKILAEDGVLIPLKDVLKVAVVASPLVYERAVGTLEANGVSLGALRSRMCNSVHKDRTRALRPRDLITSAATWATIDYATITPEPVHGQARWTMERDATGHGLLLWFDAVLTDGIGFSTAPGLECVHPQLFLPWTEPVGLHTGDRVVIDLWAQPDGSSWGWNSEIFQAKAGSRIHLKQSTFLSDLSIPTPSRTPMPATTGNVP